MEKKITVSDAELEIMKILWKRQIPLSAYEIRQHLEQSKQWERTTILTLIRRLVKKGAIHQEKKEVYYYTANISEEVYAKQETKEFVDKIYHGNIKNLVTALFQGNNLTKQDIKELKTYIEEKDNTDEE